ncbi:LlaMI family restriction endonuclease [Lysinibacillus cavernae]|uniref:LlaMI family restriction endonuclease n=1 Tax=Lysinibacillus cavernae TaxID=2666135 RepID=UPI0012D98515|nr:LlaMI family restriction endonuclease [Lysinibacillus cavernae]
MTTKEQIIKLFRQNVKGKYPDISGTNINHDGNKGHWLEKQFGVSANGDNRADLYGYELKNETTSKTTFGDWSANRYIFNDPNFSHVFKERRAIDRRDHFLKIFGKPNIEKNGRYSWSGEPCPKIDKFNKFGQKLEITPKKDIIAIYDFSKDEREDKFNIVPDSFRNGIVILAIWFGEVSPSQKRSDKCLKAKLEDKFNDKGWFTCKKGLDGAYHEICFGEPFSYDLWIKLVEKGIVFFDSGMYEGNARPYSQWRANNSYWDSLIVDRYE